MQERANEAGAPSIVVVRYGEFLVTALESLNKSGGAVDFVLQSLDGKEWKNVDGFNYDNGWGEFYYSTEPGKHGLFRIHFYAAPPSPKKTETGE